MKQSEAAELVAVLSAAFTRPLMTEKTMQVYESMIVDLDHEPAKKAVARLVATSKWLPSIAEIRAASVETQQGARRLGMEAWGDVLQAIQRVGFIPRFHPDHEDPLPPRPRFADPIVGDCVRIMGGWMAFQDLKDEMSVRSKFCDLYDGLAERGRRDLVAGEALALPAPTGGASRRLHAVPGFAAIGSGGKR